MSQVIQTLENGLPPSQIRILIEARLESMASIGEVIREDQKRISDTINRTRRNYRIRVKLAKHFNVRYETLWGEDSHNGANAAESNIIVSKRKANLARVQTEEQI